MTRDAYVFTSESVSEGHPDKLCDQISDAILDNLLAEEPQARVAAEVFATSGTLVLGGEIGLDDRTKLAGYLERVEDVAREVIRDIGYEQDDFHWETCKVLNFMHSQAEQIWGDENGGVATGGAGDQGIMFGYAVNETPQLMPAPIQYSHAILRHLAEARHAGQLPLLGPDAKAQLSVRYAGGKPVGVTQLVISHQHRDENQTSDDIRAIVEPYVREVLPDGWLTKDTVWHVNPTGKFVTGGPHSDAGLTGRKIIVDTYGGSAPHGGGAFSGKDPTKVDRSAAYAARYLAKNVVAAGLAQRCLIQLSYAIGVAEPLSIYVDTYGTGTVSEAAIEAAIPQVMDLKPHGIRDHLDLCRPIYRRTAAYGHFGREPDKDGGFSWEALDLVEALQNEIGRNAA